MVPAELLTTLIEAGCRLMPDGDMLRVHAPQQVLTDDLRQAIRQHKAALLALLVQSAPAHDASLTAPSVAALETPAAPWRCPLCHDTRRWRSIYGVLICGTCHPPGDVALVGAWREDDEA